MSKNSQNKDRFYGCNTAMKEPEEKQEDGQIRNPWSAGRCRFSRKWIDGKCDRCRRKHDY